MEEGDTAGVLARIPKRQKLNIVGIGKVRQHRISVFPAHMLSQRSMALALPSGL